MVKVQFLTCSPLHTHLGRPASKAGMVHCEFSGVKEFLDKHFVARHIN